MKRHTTLGVAALSLGLCGFGVVATAQNPAAPAGNPPATQPDGAKKPRRGGDANRAAKKKDPTKDIADVEAMVGTPLTEAQKTQLRDAIEARDEAIRQAREAYQAQLTQITGLTPQQMKAKKREMNRKKKEAAGAAAAR